MMKILPAAAAAILLVGCGEGGDQAADLKAKAGAPVEVQAVADAVISAVDVEAAKGLAKEAAKRELAEALPAEAAAVAAIVDEKALVNGLGRAVDTERVREAADGFSARLDDHLSNGGR